MVCYDSAMKYVLGIALCLLAGVTAVQAYELSVTSVSTPYEIIPIEGDPEVKQVYLGTLEDFPVMYEIRSAESFILSAQLMQQYQGGADPKELSLMIIRENDKGRGVTEVARLRPASTDWVMRQDSVYGMDFWDGPVVQQEVEAGTYRIEVSTPENLGQYILSIGDQDEPAGYFTTIGQVRTTHKFFGFSVVKLLASSYVYYPLGIFLLLFAIQRTWKYRKSIAHVA